MRTNTRIPCTPTHDQKHTDTYWQEFFADLLSSAATKRDAKAYLTRLKSPPKPKPVVVSKTTTKMTPGPYVNLGNLFPGSRAAEQSPVFSQSPVVETEFEEEETLHIALVKIRDVASLSEGLLLGIGETLAQLNRLSISPCVIVESVTTADSRAQVGEDVDSVVAAVNAYSQSVARRVDNVFTTTGATQVRVAQPKLLVRPLRRGQIPVLSTIAFNEDDQRMALVPANESMLAVTREFAGLNVNTPQHSRSTSPAFEQMRKHIVLDRIITVDSAGGVPNEKSPDGSHVFLNLEQEYEPLKRKLQSGATNSKNVHTSFEPRSPPAMPPIASSNVFWSYDDLR